MAENIKNEITTFVNEEFGEVRTIIENDKTYFCGADIAKALGYVNSRKALADHCRAKGVTKRDTLTKGGIQELTYIDEGNVYRLIAHSKLPDAEKFESWVFDEVVPSVVKTGGYIQKGREIEYFESRFNQISKEQAEDKEAILTLQKIVLAQNKMLDVKPDMKKISNWKNKCGYPKVKALVSLTGIAFDDVLDMIYDKMTDNAGFLSYSAMVDYKEKYHLDSVPYTIDAVADSPTYQRDFVICANELIREFKRKNTASEPTPTPLDKFDAAVRPLIELRKDKSAKGAMTLKEVYKKMHSKQSWAVMRGKNKCNTNKQLIMKKDNEYELFCKTVNEMIGEME